MHAPHKHVFCCPCSVHSAQPGIGWNCAYSRGAHGLLQGFATRCSLVHGMFRRAYMQPSHLGWLGHHMTMRMHKLVVSSVGDDAHHATHIGPPACVSVDLSEEVTAIHT